MDYDYHEIMRLENQLCFPLYAAARNVTGLYTPWLKPLGLTYTQYIVFLVLWERDGLTVSEICERLMLDNGTLSPLLKKMEQAGYIERKRCREDDRVVVVTLTEEERHCRRRRKMCRKRSRDALSCRRRRHRCCILCCTNCLITGNRTIGNKKKQKHERSLMMKTVYDFTVKDRQGNDVSLSEYKGKVLLIVNTATGCGFTPHYDPLEEMYKEMKDKGFEILDFPCNQFGNQAPGEDEEIHSFCQGRFGITFPQFSKIDVNGDDAIPLYKYLTTATTFEGFGKSPMALMMAGIAKKMDKDYKNNGNIKWNFTKFLIDREGNIKARFEPTADMQLVRDKIAELI